MVDRITPATSDRERDLLKAEFGVEDNWPVFCEPFRQWVLEDKFTAGRPALEKVGVQFVKDVSPFELMKIRILNGGHATIAYPAGLMDIHFVHEAMQEPLVRNFLAKLERDEIVPTVPPVPGVVLDDYYQLIEKRFSNPKIGDTVRRLCLDGSNRQPKFIIPTIADRLAAGKGVSGLALESALWCRYCFGETEFRRGDRSQRSELGPAAGDVQSRQGQSCRLACHGRHLWRGRNLEGLRGSFRAPAENAMGNRHAADADALPLRHALTGERRRKELNGSRSEKSVATRLPLL